MTYLGNFGQAGAILGAVTTINQQIANVAIQQMQIKAGSKLSAKELQHKAMLAPAPVAIPFTAATTGFSIFLIFRIIGL